MAASFFYRHSSMSKTKIPDHLRGPRSPHSEDRLEDVIGRELDAWVAAELGGYSTVRRRPDGDYDGATAGQRKSVPNYCSPDAVRALAGRLTNGRRLVLRSPSGVVNIDNASTEQCELANRALVLESMKNRGAV